MPDTETELPASYAAGERLPYAQLPVAVRDWVADQLDGPVIEVTDRRGGFSPGVAATVRSRSGAGLFVKAVTDAINVDALRFYRNERDRGLRLPRVPGLLKPQGAVELSVDGDQWIVITFPLLPGSTPRHPWSATDAVRCLDRLASLRAALTPSPWPQDPAATSDMVGFLSGWQKLAAEQDDPWRTDPWISRRLDGLLELERSTLARIPGDTLSHWDLRADNIMICDDDVWFVDWAHARNAAGWLDAVLLSADIIASGADRADGGEIDVLELMARHPAFAGSDRRTRTGILGSLAATLHLFSRQPAAPGLPTIRRWQAETAETILRFVRRTAGDLAALEGR